MATPLPPPSGAEFPPRPRTLTSIRPERISMSSPATSGPTRPSTPRSFGRGGLQHRHNRRHLGTKRQERRPPGTTSERPSPISGRFGRSSSRSLPASERRNRSRSSLTPLFKPDSVTKRVGSRAVLVAVAGAWPASTRSSAVRNARSAAADRDPPRGQAPACGWNCTSRRRETMNAGATGRRSLRKWTPVLNSISI